MSSAILRALLGDGAAGVDGKITLLATATASLDTSVEFTGLSSNYKKFIIIADNVNGGTAGQFQMRFSTNNGSSYDSGSNYTCGFAGRVAETAGGSNVHVGSSEGISQFNLSDTDSLGNGANQASCFIIEIFNPSASQYTHMTYSEVNIDSNDEHTHSTGGGVYLSTTAVDAIQFFRSASAAFNGTFKLYGVE